MKRKWKAIVLALIGIFVAIQFIPVQRNNSPVTADVQAPADVKAILRTSCYDCHSHKTKWPLYSYVAPVSWFIVYDVQEGRKHLNFSQWDTYPESAQEFIKTKIYKEVSEGAMPLPQYVLLHPNARISDADLNILKQWAEPELDIEHNHDDH